MNIRVCLRSRLLAEALRDYFQQHDTQHLIAVNEDTFPVLTSTDLFLTDGHKGCDTLRERHPEARFVLIDIGYSDEEVIFLLLMNHYDGIFSPEFNPALLDRALRAICDGQFWLEQKHLKGLIFDQRARNHAEIVNLTPQERRIIAMISKGMRNREIADQLCLCEQTIKSHVSKIFRKLKVSNRSQLVSLVMSNPTPSPH